MAYSVKRYGDAVPAVASDGERRDVEVEGHDADATVANMLSFKESIFACV